MEQKQLFKVRDLRQKTQFKIDDLYLNGYARICGINATLVYMSLCRHAEFESQKAFPSQNKIAWEHGVSTRTIKRGLKELIKYNIIMVKQEKINGKFNNNIYYLLDKSEWKKSTEGQDSHTEHRGTETVGQTPRDYKSPRRITNSKDNKDYKDNKECVVTPSQIAKEFFNNQDKQINTINYLISKGIDEQTASSEIKKFISYWTEPNKSGTKQRWELEKTFELSRRLSVWFQNHQKFNKSNKINIVKL